MASAGLELALNHPHPVFFPAHEFGRQMVWRGQCFDVGVIGEFVGVVRHVHFLLAHQGPVVAVQGAVEDEHVIVGTRARGAWVRCVVGQVWRQLDPTLTRQVLPGAARLHQRVGGIAQHHRFAGTAGRRGVHQLHLVVGVFGTDGFVHVLVDWVADVRLSGGGQRRYTGRVDVPRVVLGGHAHALVAQEKVPHRLGAGLRNRERDAWQHVVNSRTAFLALGTDGIFQGVVQHRLRQCHSTVGGVDIDPEGREALEQLQGGRGELTFVLVDVLAIDHHQRLFPGKRVWTHAVAALVAGRWGHQAALVSGNRTVGVGA
ncbi:hypothetical protein D3C81_681060 [compost metagenome]